MTRAAPGAILASFLATLTLAIAAPSAQASPAPVPTDANGAQNAAQQAAAEVAKAQSRVDKQMARVQRTSLAADRAEAQYQHQLVVLSGAQRAADRAAARFQAAQSSYDTADRALATFIAVQYQSGGAASDAGQLLVATDPTQLLDAADTQRQLDRYQSVLVARAQSALDASTAANTARQDALIQVQVATAAVKRSRDSAARNYADARQGLLALRAQLTKARSSQREADAVLSLYLGGWSVADPARAAALNKKYMELAALHRNDQMAPRRGHWTAAMGQSVVYRALQMIGTPYAWAGGGPSGPSHGICASGAASGDCHVVGFDCSGLTMYSWAPYLAIPHFAASQYNDGSFHPAPAQLLPGDLVFWSSNGRANGIHHVALYVGDGNVVQAPESGDIVRITPLGNVAEGYFGATRPMS
jgi:cell wall-associated NlpC family hydrolase